MARKRRSRQAKPQELYTTHALVGSMAIGAFFVTIPEEGWFFVISFLAISLIIGAGGYYIFAYRKERDRRRALRELQIADVDTMSGVAFEEYVAELFRGQGFHIETTATTGDFGVDLILRKDGERLAVQAKRYSKPVSLAAIQEAVAGMQFYGCGRCMVVTNNYFTRAAKRLGESTECILIDRNALLDMLAAQPKSS